MGDYSKDVWFWRRLKSFIEDIEVSDQPGYEEKEMILYICSQKLNEGIFSSDNGDFCPKCESSKVAHDHEYYYCTNKGCCHVWAKSQERSV